MPAAIKRCASRVEFSLITVNATWPGLNVLQPFAAGDQLAIGRKNGGDAHDIAGGNARIPQGQLETGKPLAMFSHAFGEENFLRDERHGVVPERRCLLNQSGDSLKKTSVRKITSSPGAVNTFPLRAKNTVRSTQRAAAPLSVRRSANTAGATRGLAFRRAPLVGWLRSRSESARIASTASRGTISQL